MSLITSISKSIYIGLITANMLTGAKLVGDEGVNVTEQSEQSIQLSKDSIEGVEYAQLYIPEILKALGYDMSDVTVQINGEKYLGMVYSESGTHQLTVKGKKGGKQSYTRLELKVSDAPRVIYTGHEYGGSIGDEIEISLNNIYKDVGEITESNLVVTVGGGNDYRYDRSTSTLYIKGNKTGEGLLGLQLKNHTLPKVEVNYKVYTHTPYIKGVKVGGETEGGKKLYVQEDKEEKEVTRLLTTKKEDKELSNYHYYVGRGDRLEYEVTVGDNDLNDNLKVKLKYGLVGELEQEISTVKDKDTVVRFELTAKDIPVGVYNFNQLVIEDKHGNTVITGNLPKLTVVDWDTEDYIENLNLYKGDIEEGGYQYRSLDNTVLLGYLDLLSQVTKGDINQLTHLDVIKKQLVRGKLYDKVEGIEQTVLLTLLKESDEYMSTSYYQRIGKYNVNLHNQYIYEKLRSKVVKERKLTDTDLDNIWEITRVLYSLHNNLDVSSEELKSMEGYLLGMPKSVQDYVTEEVKVYKLLGEKSDEIITFKEKLKVYQKKLSDAYGYEAIQTLPDEDIELYIVALNRRNYMLGDYVGGIMDSEEQKLAEVSGHYRDVTNYIKEQKASRGKGTFNVEERYIGAIREYNGITLDNSQGVVLSKSIVDSKILGKEGIKLSKSDYKDIDVLEYKEGNVDNYNKYINDYFSEEDATLLNAIHYMNTINGIYGDTGISTDLGTKLYITHSGLPQKIQDSMIQEIDTKILLGINQQKKITDTELKTLNVKGYINEHSTHYQKVLNSYMGKGKQITKSIVEGAIDIVNYTEGYKEQELDSHNYLTPELYKGALIERYGVTGYKKDIITIIVTDYSEEYAETIERKKKYDDYKLKLSRGSYCINY